MKKIFILLLSVLMLCCLTLAVGAEPAEPAEYHRGDSFTVAVELPEAYSEIKSGAVQYSYDSEAFELVSAEWTVSGTFLKSIDTDNNLGVFAFASAGNVSGNVLSFGFKVDEEAELADYEFNFTFTFTNSDNSTFTVTLDAITVSVVDIVVEEEDEIYPEHFAAAVDAVSETENNEEKYSAICEAANLYSLLTEDEKAEVLDKYEELLEQVEAYNSGAETVNEQVEGATRVAFSAIIRAFEYLSALLRLIADKIW